MSWVRKDSPPDTIRITIVIKTADYPELTDFVWKMPWGKGSARIRDILSRAVKLSLGKKVEEPQAAPQSKGPVPAAAPQQPSSAFTYIDEPRNNNGLSDELVVQNTADIVEDIASKY